MKERKLIVRKGHRDYSLKAKPNGGNPPIPVILLKGSWLEESGFIIGSPIRVQVENRRLIITLRT